MKTMAGVPALAVAHGEGEATWFGPNRMVVKATAETTGGAYGLVESWIPAGSSPPLHVHHREDEAFWVLEGRVRFVCGEEELVADAGSHVFLPREVPHTFVAEGAGIVHLLTLVTPGGSERFFVEAGRPADGPGLPPPGPPDIARLREVAPRFDLEILGPPLAPAGAR